MFYINIKKWLISLSLFVPALVGFVSPPLMQISSKNKVEIMSNNDIKTSLLNTDKKYNLSSAKVAFAYNENTGYTHFHYFINKDVDKQIENDYPNVKRKLTVWERAKNNVGNWIHKTSIYAPKDSSFTIPYEYRAFFGYATEWDQKKYKYEFRLEYWSNENHITSVRLDEDNNIVSIVNPNGSIDENTSIEKKIHKHIHNLNEGTILIYPDKNNAINFAIDKKEFDIMDYYHPDFKTKLVVWEKPKHSNNWYMKKLVISPVFWFGLNSKYKITYSTSGVVINDNAYDYEFSLEYTNKHGNLIASLRVDLNNKIIEKTAFDGDEITQNNPNDDNLNINKDEQIVEATPFVTLLAILIPLLSILIINLIFFLIISNKRNNINNNKNNIQNKNNKTITIHY